MKTSIPISLILIPTIGALTLFLYGIFSDRWVQMDLRKVEYTEKDRVPNGLIILSKRIAFLKYLGLFSKCIEYRWLNVVDINSTNTENVQRHARMCMRPCRAGEIQCGICCIAEQRRCDHIPECETLDDEMNCKRLFEDDVWLDEDHHCFRHKINVFNLKIEGHSKNYDSSDPAYPRYSNPYSDKLQSTNFDYYYPSLNYRSPSEHFLHGIMVWLLISAAILQLLIIVSLVLVRPCRKHLSIPFTCIIILCALGFLCGIIAIGIFLWNWVHRKIYMTSFQYHNDNDGPTNLLLSNAVIYRLNPWLSSIEVLDISFYITCGAVFLCMVTTIISFLFFCGAFASSRFSFEQGKGSYEIVKILPYEDHYIKT